MESKHRRISKRLLDEIAAGRFGESGRMPSEAQLARRFHVSRPTVARALRDLENDQLIERRVGAGTFVRSAKAGSTLIGSRQFGLIVPGLATTEIFESICGELASLARGQDYSLLWANEICGRKGEDLSVEEARSCCDQFIASRVRGVFFAPFEHIARSSEINRQLAAHLHRAGVAVVLLDRDVEHLPARSAFDLVGIDNFAAGYVAAHHLIKLGARRVVFVARPNSAPTVMRRIAGAREALLEHSLPAAEGFARFGDPRDRAFVEEFERSHADAAICANDETAARLIHSLATRGVRVPQHLRVVGFDDVRVATQISVPLTTVHQPTRDIASTAFHAMLERIAHPSMPPRILVVSPRLQVRESCGAYGADPPQSRRL